jgi:cell division protein DivIC
MASTKQAVRNRRIVSPISGAMLVITLVALVLLTAMLINGHHLQQKISGNEARLADLEKQIEEEELRTKEIEELQKYMNSDEYLEQTAKEKLGFVKDGEIIFKENK